MLEMKVKIANPVIFLKSNPEAKEYIQFDLG